MPASSEDPCEDVARYLADVTSGLTYGKNVRIGPLGKPSTNQSLANAIPQRCVAVKPIRGVTGSTMSESWAGGGGIDKPTVQIWVRGTANNYEDARDLAIRIFKAMDRKPPPGYFECRALYSQPEFIQQDEVGCHEFLIHLDLRKQV